MTILLTKPQAKAIHSAMLTLDKAGARLHAKGLKTGTKHRFVEVREAHTGRVTIGVDLDGTTGLSCTLEDYPSRVAFAQAYGLK